MAPVPIPGTDVGALMEDRGLDCTSLLHARGLVLFRGLTGLSPVEIRDFVRAHFPGIPDHIPPSGVTNNVEDICTAMGNTKDSSGNYDADFVPAHTNGAPLLNPTDEEIEAGLAEIEGESTGGQRKQCTFMEWHTDALFTKSPPSYNILYCKQDGGSATGFIDASIGLKNLPADLRAKAETAMCHYKSAAAAMDPSRVVQMATMSKERQATLLDDNNVFTRGMVQVHPHTGEKVLRLHLRTLHTIDNLPPKDGKRLAWQAIRAAQQQNNAYLHYWKPGDLIVWDQRKMIHARVPYDTENDTRLMWRMEFRRDPMDKKYMNPDVIGEQQMPAARL